MQFVRVICYPPTQGKALLLAILTHIAVSPFAIASAESYPEAASKKGLQVELLDDALALGVKHAALNINLSQLIAPSADTSDSAFLHHISDGQTFAFYRERIERLDHSIKTLSDHSVLVYLIVLAYEADDDDVNRIMLHVNYSKEAPNRLSAFNTRTEEGRAWLKATLEFLAERWSRPDRQHGRVVGYILGNEVNSHWWWSNMGPVKFEEFATDYSGALAIVHSAIKRHAEWARVYISLDHHWGIRYQPGDERQAYPGKDLVDYLGRNPDTSKIDWHIAYHPYPENLFEPRFWRDQTALPHPQTPRITFTNLEVLTEYLRRSELLYEGKSRRVILSEQGFHTPDGPDGEAMQAAAFCYAYRKVAGLDGVDAFILHRHVDHPNEGGLRLGLRRFTPMASDARPQKLIYECFRRADEPDWEQAFDFALPLIGIHSWTQVGEHSGSSTR